MSGMQPLEEALSFSPKIRPDAGVERYKNNLLAAEGSKGQPTNSINSSSRPSHGGSQLDRS